MCAQRKPAGLEPHPGYFSDDLAAADPEVAAAVAGPLREVPMLVALVARES